MRVVAYSIKNFEKELLAKANHKKHDITLISNPISLETAVYAAGKDAAIVFATDNVTAPVIDKLADLGVKYIVSRSVGTEHIDTEAAARRNIKIAAVAAYSPEAIAEFSVALALALSRKLVATVEQSKKFDFTIDQQLGFNFHGKTAGIIGLGQSGLATASILKGFGCQILGYDINPPKKSAHIKVVALETLLRESDIILLHIPLAEGTRYLVNEKAIQGMKDGVMLINTSSGSLINTEDVLNALDKGKIGYLGLDVYEYEKGLFFSDHHLDESRDALLERLMLHPNVIVTPHHAFLTQEAIKEISNQIIQQLDEWQRNRDQEIKMAASA